MSRKGRSDAYMRIWIRFSDYPLPENQLIELEQAIRGAITEKGHIVYALDFRVKDDRVNPQPD